MPDSPIVAEYEGGTFNILAERGGFDSVVQQLGTGNASPAFAPAADYFQIINKSTTAPLSFTVGGVTVEVGPYQGFGYLSGTAVSGLGITATGAWQVVGYRGLSLQNSLPVGLFPLAPAQGPGGGQPGRDVYQVWLDSGNTGSEQDFLASLRGADGLTPLLRGQSGILQVSRDNGVTWADIGPYVGPQGVGVSSAILNPDNDLVFGLSSGGTLLVDGLPISDPLARGAAEKAQGEVDALEQAVLGGLAKPYPLHQVLVWDPTKAGADKYPPRDPLAWQHARYYGPVDPATLGRAFGPADEWFNRSNTPASLARDWVFSQGANAQLVYESVSGANGQRGSSASADGADFGWGSGFAAFDGTDDYGTGTLSNPGGNAPWTLALLVRQDASDGRKAVSFGGASAGTGLSLGSVGDTGRVEVVDRLVQAHDTGHLYGSGFRLLFLTYSARVLTLYAGGTQVWTATRGSDLNIPANAPVNFGRAVWSAGEYWYGGLARVGWHNAALTAAQVAAETARIAGEARALGLDSTDFPPATSTPAPVTAAALRDSVGVGVAPGYDDTANNPTSRLLSYLQDLGVTRIRGSITKTPPQYYLDFFAQTAAAGIRNNMIVGRPDGSGGQYADGEQAALVNALKTTWAGKVHQLEGPNEWDLQGSGWQERLRSFYAAYRAAVRADPALNNLVFYGGSMAYGSNFDTYVDNNQEGAVLHPYPGGEIPEIANIAQQLAKARNSAGSGKPVIATEMGYNNGFNATGQGNIGVPEDVDAHYMIREFVYNYWLGIVQNYKYVMFDMKPDNPGRTQTEAWYGLVAVEGDPAQPLTTWTLRKKPSFEALKRMLAYLADTGTGSAPASLPYGVSGVPANAVVVPIARKDGSFDVAAWLKNELYHVSGTMNNPAGRYAVADTTANMTLHFPSSMTVDAFQPSVGATVTRLGTGVTQLSASLNGKVRFFRVRPA